MTSREPSPPKGKRRAESQTPRTEPMPRDETVSPLETTRPTPSLAASSRREAVPYPVPTLDKTRPRSVAKEVSKPTHPTSKRATLKRAPEVAARSPGEPWVELLAPVLDVVFLGFNPSLPAWRTGHYYANPGNRFYALLFASGLTPRLFSPHEDRLLLAQGIGAADLVLEPSARADELPSSRFVDAAPGLVARLSRVAPRAVCCNGVGVYRAIFRENPPALGLVPGKEIAGAVVFVSPSTSGLANGFSRERSAVFQQLADWLRAHPRV